MEAHRKLLVRKNREGKFRLFLIRKYREGDGEGMVSCIRSEYGDTYFRKNYYIPGFIQTEAVLGKSSYVVVQTSDGIIVGMMALKESRPEEGICEIAVQVLKKEYRGYGLAEEMFAYGIKLMEEKDYSAVYSTPFLYHDMTQRLLLRQGFKATGVLLNVFDVEKMIHSYENGRNRKHSKGLQVLAWKKRDAGRLYLPPEHQAFCQDVYDSLGVAYRLGTVREDGNGGGQMKTAGKIVYMPPYTEFSCHQEEDRHSLEIRIDTVGENVETVFSQIQRQYPLTGKQTANVLLNINDLHALYAYRILEKKGYFFTGLKPLCRNCEYLIMHHAGEMDFYPEDYFLSKEFETVLSYCMQAKKDGVERKNK